MAKTRRLFTAEFKAEVVRLARDGGHSVCQLGQRYDVGESVIYQWVRQAKIDGGNGVEAALTTSEKEELASLRKEVRELKRERDFLRQATAYFAAEQK